MIVQTNTGKAELCFVKVAPDARNFRISKGYPDPPTGDLCYTTDLNVWNTGDAILPEGNWQIVGNPFELSSEVIRGIVPEMRDSGYPFEVQEITDTWKDLLDKWEIYQTNPYKHKPTFSYDFGEYGPTDSQLKGAQDDYEYKTEIWQQAQERVGNWILLKKTI